MMFYAPVFHLYWGCQFQVRNGGGHWVPEENQQPSASKTENFLCVNLYRMGSEPTVGGEGHCDL